MQRPIFITGNQSKADYLARLLEMKLEHQKIELDEIQSVSLEEVVTHKVKQAYELVGKPVLVEDVGLSFNALNGLPGPFIKFFVDAPTGLENLCRMMDGFDDRSAKGECVFGYYDGTTLERFSGHLHGNVAQHPRGENGFGWDKVFEPEGYEGRTRAELNDNEYAELYKIIRPFGKIKAFLMKDEA
jgi:non-canonical purine NTP pyrophosphatase (RdgB/HAM1 family)